MLAQIQKFLAEIHTASEKICFAMGYDCEMNGADEKNCHFSLFSSPENTKAWESGKEKARLTKRAADCDHEWVSAVNEVIVSGEYCTKCHAVRSR